ncbi:MAG TPA: hypothetical protein VKR53_09080 [Puia sp.]|nr:hypothetical protein [Puia sp.]
MILYWQKYYSQNKHVPKKRCEDFVKVSSYQLAKNNFLNYTIYKRNPEGLHTYIKCAKCDRLVKYVYLNENEYACRKCLNLCWAVQRLSEPMRLLLMLNKQKDKLAKAVTKGAAAKIKKRIHIYNCKYEVALEKELKIRYGNSKLI